MILLLAAPSAALLVEPTVDPPVRATVSPEPLRRFERCGFERDDSWLVRAEFAPRSIAGAAPDWPRRAETASQKLPLFLGLAAMVLLAGAAGFVAFGLNHRPQVFRDAHVTQSSPPDALPVAIGAALARSGRANWDVGLGTLLDLARRGVIRIGEIPGGSVLRRRDFAITEAGEGASLRPAERALYDLLFTSRSGARRSVKFTELARIFGSASRWKRFSAAVRAELDAEGLIDADRSRTRARATTLAVGTVVVGVAGLLAAVPFVDEYGGASLMIGVAFIAVGIVGIAVSQGITPLTDDGVRRSGWWQAYGRHLKVLSSQRHGVSVTPDLFEQTLPFAVAFGVGLAWAKALHAQGFATGPSWLGALSRDGEAGPSMAATVAMLSSGQSAGHSVDHAAAGASASAAAGGGSSGAG